MQHQTALFGAWLQLALWHKVNGEADKARSYSEKALRAATAVRNIYFCQVIQDQLNKLPVGGAA